MSNVTNSVILRKVLFINFKISKHNLIMTSVYLLYRVILDVIYINWVSPIFGYMGFENNSTMFSVIVSYVILVPVILLIPKNDLKVSNLILQLHFIVMIIPLTVLYAFLNNYIKFILMCIGCFCLQIILIKYLKNLKIRKIKNAKLFFWLIIIGLTLSSYLYVFATQNINYTGFQSEQIYEIRAEQKINSTLFSYLITWQYRIINPILIIYSFVNKKHLYIMVSVGLQALLFLFIPHKEIVFSIFLIFVILLIDKKNWRFDLVFTIFLLFVTVSSVWIYEHYNDVNLFGSVPVRLLYLPAEIKFSHYDFFSQNEKLLYSEGLIGRLFGIDYPYSVSSGYLIGNYTSNENTGYLAYAYDNSGFFGMILMSCLFVFILKIIDSLTAFENRNIVFAIICYPMIILNDGDLLTLLLTGGLFLLILVLFIQEDIGLVNKNHRGIITYDYKSFFGLKLDKSHKI